MCACPSPPAGERMGGGLFRSRPSGGVDRRYAAFRQRRAEAHMIKGLHHNIKGLHHNAYRCRDSEETRVFYEDFLGLRLVSAFEIDEGRGLHTFFEMDEGSCLAFFEVPGKS